MELWLLHEFLNDGDKQLILEFKTNFGMLTSLSLNIKDIFLGNSVDDIELGKSWFYKEKCILSTQ